MCLYLRRRGNYQILPKSDHSCSPRLITYINSHIHQAKKVRIHMDNFKISSSVYLKYSYYIIFDLIIKIMFFFMAGI